MVCDEFCVSMDAFVVFLSQAWCFPVLVYGLCALPFVMLFLVKLSDNIRRWAERDGYGK